MGHHECNSQALRVIFSVEFIHLPVRMPKVNFYSLKKSLKTFWIKFKIGNVKYNLKFWILMNPVHNCKLSII